LIALSDSSLTIKQALAWARQELVENGVSDDGQFDSSAIDSKVLLSACLDCELVYLHIWPEKYLNHSQLEHLQTLVAKRILGHPVAYLIGYKDFWSLHLQVSPATLIPRPETERLVEIALDLPMHESAKVLDLGTGTGAIALALASEKPNWSITGLDKNLEAVKLAKENATSNQLEQVVFIQSDWFSGVGKQQFNLIVTNPPYVEQDNELLKKGDVRFEPSIALTSGVDGLDDIRLIVAAGKKHLLNNAWLVIEHGYQQGELVSHIFRSHGYSQIHTEQDLNDLPRITLGLNKIT
jgi:release factor glutamine methyltransferase